MASDSLRTLELGYCLVTGGAGFLGRHLAAELLRRGLRVRVFDRCAGGTTHERLDVLIGDLRDPAQVREYPGVPPGRYARLTMRASGWGMDPQVQDRVASALASSEDSEGAEELGVASALRAFRQAGGLIAAEAEPGRELVVVGYLPTSPM